MAERTFGLYTDRRDGPRQRTETRISNEGWRAFASLVRSQLNIFAFGYAFPEVCEDGATRAAFGCDERAFFEAVHGVTAFPSLDEQFRGPDWGEPEAPPTDAILDGLEWCSNRIGAPTVLKHHGFLSHDHLRWDAREGRRMWVEEVNRILSRQGLAYAMDENGLIQRVVEGEAAEALVGAIFRSGDSETDQLLEHARRRFFDRDGDAGQDAIEALWDAFERIKTHAGTDKKSSIAALLNKCIPEPAMRALIEGEVLALTKIGNEWRIRHHETGKHELGLERGFRDYLFLRMFSLLWFLLFKPGASTAPSQSR